MLPTLEDHLRRITRNFTTPLPEADALALMDWFAGQVLPYQKVREVHFVDVLPTSTAGTTICSTPTARARATTAAAAPPNSAASRWQ